MNFPALEDDPFTAPEGTVWHYRHVLNKHQVDELIFVVLPRRFEFCTSSDGRSTHLRQYLDLATGKTEYFTKGSALNQRSKRFV